MMDIRVWIEKQLSDLNEKITKVNAHNNTEIARIVGKREAFLDALNFLESEVKNDD